MTNKTILVIEDNEMNMKLVRALLEVNGNKILEAMDAESGLEILEKERPDLVLMDIQLPGLDGYAATRRIKENPSLRNIPVVALTAYAMRGDREKALEMGCDGYISKPINTRTFLSSVEQFMHPAPVKSTALTQAGPYQKRVLIVDDEPRNLRLLEAMLPGEKFEILKAQNGEEALAMVYAEQPDVILLDIMMPGIDGLEVARRIKGDPAVRNIPIIMITALAGKDNKLIGLEAGAEEYLTKPVRQVELKARISSMLQLREFRDQLSIRNQSERSFPLSIDAEAFNRTLPEENARVLLVEDNEVDASIISRALKDRPYTLECVRSGRESLEIIREGRVDLVLLDILLPGIDGFETCRRIKQLERGRDLPVIFITCLDDMESKVTGIKLGTDDFLVKPINTQELLARINVLLEKKRQIDKLRQHYEKALNSAIVDWLTGLYNHGYFQSFLNLEIKRSLRQKYPVGLLMIDVDDFKRYNDDLGHAVGDEILRGLAQIVRGVIREVDLAARYGGDEFAVVLPYSDGEGAVAVAQRIQGTVRDFHLASGGQKKPEAFSVSIGIAAFPGDALSIEDLVQTADQALYRAKRRGKNQIFRHEPPRQRKQLEGA